MVGDEPLEELAGEVAEREFAFRRARLDIHFLES